MGKIPMLERRAYESVDYRSLAYSYISKFQGKQVSGSNGLKENENF